MAMASKKTFQILNNVLKKGLSVYQGNLNEGLQEFRTQSFDIVVLSLTLQEVLNPVQLLIEMCRVGKHVIVSFPNFGHWFIRLQYLLSGKAPKTKTLPFEWYNTPNIRVLTCDDFRTLCNKEHIHVVQEIPLFQSRLLRDNFPLTLSNLFSQYGIFILEKH